MAKDTGFANRGPLPYIILATCGEDVRQCINCSLCDDFLSSGMDLTFGEVMRAAARDDALALTNRTIWNCDDLMESRLHCQAGIDIPAVILTLRREAEIRGFGAPDIINK